jgi:hypothetical protein
VEEAGHGQAPVLLAGKVPAIRAAVPGPNPQKDLPMNDDLTWGSIHTPLWKELTNRAFEFERRDRNNKWNTHVLIGRYMTAVARGDWGRLGELVSARVAEGGEYFCHFGINHLLMLQAVFEREFPEAARQGLRRMIEVETGPLGSAYRNDFEFQNDNFPFMAVAIQIVGGQFIGRQDVANMGLQKLRRYGQIMIGCGVTSEFCSPNYASWQIGPLSLVAALAENPEARHLAQMWCEFLWFEIAQRWHNGLRQLVGPHSRAYQEQIAGGWGHAQTLLRRVIGAPLGLDPELMYRVGHTEDNCMLAYFALGPIYCPSWARDLLSEKELPLTVEARTRSGPGWDGANAIFPSEVVTCSHLAPLFSLAGASRPWNGAWQSNVSIAYWNLGQAPPNSLGESRVAYGRTLLDDHGPLQANRYVTTFEGALNEQGGEITTYFQDDGLNCATQKNNVQLLAVRPKWLVRSRFAIRHVLLLSDFAARLPEIYVAAQRVESLPFVSPAPDIVVLRDGPVVLGLRPLAVSDLGRACALEIHRQNDHLWISLWNYRGPERLFSMEEMRSIQNGYAWIVEDASAVTPEDMHARLAAAKVGDRVDGVYREVSYDDGEVQLGMRIHHLCPDPHAMTRDGKPYSCPVFASRYVQGGHGRELVVGQARLQATQHPLFLRGQADGRQYVVYNFVPHATHWRATIGGQVIEYGPMPTGKVTLVSQSGVWRVVNEEFA